MRSHLMRMRMEQGDITMEDLNVLISEICKNVFQRVMDDKRAEEESEKLKELLKQK
jgi:hypothetical protein